jgi:hypothetical protein
MSSTCDQPTVSRGSREPGVTMNGITIARSIGILGDHCGSERNLGREAFSGKCSHSIDYWSGESPESLSRFDGATAGARIAARTGCSFHRVRLAARHGLSAPEVGVQILDPPNPKGCTCVVPLPVLLPPSNCGCPV